MTVEYASYWPISNLICFVNSKSKTVSLTSAIERMTSYDVGDYVIIFQRRSSWSNILDF